MTVISDAFAVLARVVSRSQGIPDLPLVVVPHGVEHWDEEKLRELAKKVAREVVEKLTASTEVRSLSPK